MDTTKPSSRVTVYSATGCPFCIKTKAFLKEKGITYSEIVIEPGSRQHQ